MREPEYSRGEELFLVAFFILSLSLPLAGMLVSRGGTGVSAAEKRLLAPFPPLSARPSDVLYFPGRFRAYFNDHFGLRPQLVRWQATVRAKWLGVSTSPQVLVGKDGWYFYVGDNLFDEYTRAEPLGDNALARWRQVLEAKRDWLARRNIAFLVVIAPEKQTVYPELMPDGLNRLRAASRQDELLAYMRARSDVRLLDLRPALLEAKTRERIYHRTNTHWDDVGAFVASQAIIGELSKALPRLRPLRLSDYELRREYAASGDLIDLLGLHGSILEEELNLRPREPRRATLDGGEVSRERAEADQVHVSVMAGSDAPRLVMFRDSFSTGLIPFLAERFSRGIYVGGARVDTALVEAERPDVVVLEMAERHLMAEPPADATLAER